MATTLKIWCATFTSRPERSRNASASVAPIQFAAAPPAGVPDWQFRAPRDGYRWLLWNLIMCRMPALTQRPLHTVICNQKENNFVKYWKSLLDLCCRCIILASNHEPLLQNFGQRQVQLYKLHLYIQDFYISGFSDHVVAAACLYVHALSIVLCCYDLCACVCPNTKSKASSVEQPS